MNKLISTGQEFIQNNQAYRVNVSTEVHLLGIFDIAVIDGYGSVRSHQTYGIFFLVAQVIQCELKLRCWE